MTYGRLASISVPASANLSADQFCFMTIDTNGNLVPVSTQGAQADGVLQDKPDAAGEAGQLAIATSVSKVIAGAAITAGAQVMSDASGHAITATTGNYVAGKALDAAAASGILIRVLLYTAKI